jgi:hypothetical protein
VNDPRHLKVDAAAARTPPRCLSRGAAAHCAVSVDLERRSPGAAAADAYFVPLTADEYPGVHSWRASGKSLDAQGVDCRQRQAVAPAHPRRLDRIDNTGPTQGHRREGHGLTASQFDGGEA